MSSVEKNKPAFTSARWIWHPGEPSPRNAVAEFRHTFHLNRPPASARLLISADSRYVLWLNGARLGHGPARNFPNHYEFDVREVTLQRGKNTLDVRVQHWGEGNIQSFVSRAGLIAELQDGDGNMLAATGPEWRTRISPAFETVTPRIACMMPFEEQALGVTGDTSGSRACVIGPAGCQPWGGLSPRTIPLLTDEPWDCVSVRDGGTASDAPLVLPLRAGLALLPEYRSMDSVVVDGIVATELRVPKAGRLWIKHGSMYSGPVSMFLDGRPLSFEQDEFDLRASCNVKKGRHLLVLDWNGTAHDLDIGIAIGGIPGITQSPSAKFSGSPWIFTTDKNARPQARNASSLRVLTALPVDWQPVPAEAVPKRDIYMSMTCRDTNAPMGASQVLPWTCEPLADGMTARRIILDFGRHANGFVEWDIEAGAGTVVDAAGVEGINHGRIQFTELNNNTFSHRCREGRQTFTSDLARGLRYLILDIKPHGRPVVLHAARVRVCTYPWRPQGSFRCSDTRLNQIYELSTHTLRMSSMDTFVDATYEQALWVGDMASMILQVHHYVQGESLLPERCLRLAAQSLERMPLVNSQVPSAWENRPIPNWSFFWATGARDHFRLSGDKAFARTIFPAMQKQAAFVEKSLDAEGLFAMHGDVWHFLDWNGCEDDHRHAATRTYSHENALAIASLLATAEIALAVGDKTAAARWQHLAKKMGRATRLAFWNDEAGAFAESRADGKTSPSITASTQVCALMAGLFPAALTREASRRVLASDWLPTGTPWMWSLGALQACEAGWMDDVLAGMRRLWGEMLDRGATTAWEMFEGRHRKGLPTRSWCHGWSAGPAWILPAYVLGVRPASPGWRTVTIAPQPGDLQWAEGTVPTPHGPIRIRWELGPDGRMNISQELPSGISPAEQERPMRTPARKIRPFRTFRRTGIQSGADLSSNTGLLDLMEER